MSESEVREIITPLRSAKICRAFKAAWADYMADKVRYSRWPRTRANMVFERIAFHLQDQFSDDPGIHFSFHDETVKLVIDQKLLARCKKANDRGLGANVPTRANRLFCDQSSLVPDLDKVEIVYLLDKWATQITTVLVQARDGDAKLWSYEIDDSALATAAPVTPLPTPTAPAPADASDLVQPRSKPKPKTKEEDDKN